MLTIVCRELIGQSRSVLDKLPWLVSKHNIIWVLHVYGLCCCSSDVLCCSEGLQSKVSMRYFSNFADTF